MSEITKAIKTIQDAKYLFYTPDMGGNNILKGCHLIKEFKCIDAQRELKQLVDDRQQLNEAIELLYDAFDVMKSDDIKQRIAWKAMVGAWLDKRKKIKK